MGGGVPGGSACEAPHGDRYEHSGCAEGREIRPRIPWQGRRGTARAGRGVPGGVPPPPPPPPPRRGPRRGRVAAGPRGRAASLVVHLTAAVGVPVRLAAPAALANHEGKISATLRLLPG